LRRGGDGRNFCFVNISGAAAIQLIESPNESGINRYDFVAENMDQVALELRAKTPISSGKSTTRWAS